MRIAVLLSVLVVGSGLLRAEEAKTIRIAEIQGWNDQLQDLKEFTDNEFIYTEKAESIAADLKQYIGAPVELRLQVVSVWNHLVAFEIPGEEKPDRSVAPEARLLFPFFVVQEPTEKGLVIDLKSGLGEMILKDHLGGRFSAGGFKSGLKVGDLVPLELAKTLRNGEMLTLTGKIDSIMIGTYLPQFPPRTGIIITDAKVARANEEAGH